jgi:peptidyl-tRNA hydrolase
VHAAGESVAGRVPSGTYAVVLAARDEPHLLEIEQYLKDKEIVHTSIREQGNALRGEITAIGLEPKKRSKLYRYLSSLPLLR